jgi:hypothetical protein
MRVCTAAGLQNFDFSILNYLPINYINNPVSDTTHKDLDGHNFVSSTVMSITDVESWLIST